MKKEHPSGFHVYENDIKHKDIIHYDVCILGGGPAGLTAGIYSARYGLHTSVVAKEIGGMANYAEKIENYPGFDGTGIELMQKFFKQAEKFGAEFLMSEVANLHKESDGFIIELKNSQVIHTKTLIISLGTEKRKLNIPGEDKFLGRGISYCATCDANFFKGKTVAVIGGSDSAAKASLHLSRIAKKVYIIYRDKELRAEDIEKKKIKDTGNIELVLNSIPLEIKGKNLVESIVIEKNKLKEEIKLSGVFIEIGSVPTTALTRQLGLTTDENGYILVNDNMQSNVEGVFAAGDAIKSKLKQVVVAASQGAIAAKSASDYLAKK